MIEDIFTGLTLHMLINVLGIFKLLEILAETTLRGVSDADLVENYLRLNCLFESKLGQQDFYSIRYCSCYIFD